MAAQATDYFTEVGNPGSATTLAAPGHSIGGSSFTVVSTANWPTSTGAVFAVDTFTLQTVNGVANVAVRTPGTYTEWEGVVASSTSITGATLRYGTDQNYSAGATTRVYIPVASSRENRLVQGLIAAGIKQDGTMGAITAISIATSGTGSFAGGVTDGTVPLATTKSDIISNYVVSGGVIAQTSLLTASFSDIVYYYNGVRLTKTGVANYTFTASKDTYVDISNNGTLTYIPVANNAASPALTANSIRLAIVVTNGSTITFVNQGQTTATLPVISTNIIAVSDTIGNLIYPTSSSPILVGYKLQLGSHAGIGTTSTDLNGLGGLAVIVPQGRKLKLTFNLNISSTTANPVNVSMREGATIIRGFQLITANTTNAFTYAMSISLSPTAGLHTYKLTYYTNAGTGGIYGDNGGGAGFFNEFSAELV